MCMLGEGVWFSNSRCAEDLKILVESEIREYDVATKTQWNIRLEKYK